MLCCYLAVVAAAILLIALRKYIADSDMWNFAHVAAKKGFVGLRGCCKPPIRTAHRWAVVNRNNHEDPL